MKLIYCENILPIFLHCSETWTMTDRIKNMLEVVHHKTDRELNRRKFVRFWKNLYGERVMDWKKVRQSNQMALQHIGMKTIGEYWEVRTSNFYATMEGENIQGMDIR